MEIKILEKKEIQHRTWYLCKGNLKEYLEELKSEFYDYAIQRRIVKNQYLDKLYSTIQIGDPLPSITLTYKKDKLNEEKEGVATIDLKLVEILDGLQRSFRLWSYLQASYYYSKSRTDYRTFAKELKEKNPLFFDTGVISTRLLKDLIETEEIEKICATFGSYDIYFTIWTGLTEKEVIQKMLLLNAGQKSVSKTHQFELLFLHFYETKKPLHNKINLFREKDAKANDIKRGNRDIGEFMFSSIIVSLQSLVEGKPLRVSTEKLIDIEFQDNEETPDNIFNSVFNNEYIKLFLTELYQLDELISSKEEKGKEWLSKDTSLSGLFAAVGKLIDFQDSENIDKQTISILDKLKKNISIQGLKLSEFTDEYNVLSSRSVNIGMFIRKVVMEFILNLIEGNPRNWKDVFNQEKEK
jgi:hypothetical protein